MLADTPRALEHRVLSSGRRRILVSDFDGTMTQRDFFACVLGHVDRTQFPDYWSDYLAGRRSHFDALRGIFSHLQGGEEAIMEIAHETGIDAELHSSVDRLRAAGWGIVVVSAGCAWYIERLLAQRGLELPVVSNPGQIGSDGSLEMSLPEQSLFFSLETGIDKLSVVRWASERFDDIAFAGDGRPDEASARHVPATRRFATGWLAEHFAQDGTTFQSFDRWSEIASALESMVG